MEVLFPVGQLICISALLYSGWLSFQCSCHDREALRDDALASRESLSRSTAIDVDRQLAFTAPQNRCALAGTTVRSCFSLISGPPLRILRLILGSIVVIGLSGCSGLITTFAKQSELLVGAAPLDPTEKPRTLSMIGAKAEESIGKCDAFIKRLTFGQTTAAMSLDGMTVILSALATAVHPINTIHALTAASTITAGTKTTLDKDVFATGSVSTLQSALKKSYQLPMKTYLKNLDLKKLGEEENNVDAAVALELAKISQIHAQCTLPAAQAFISEKVGE